jgi:hypothetical protein
VVYILLNALAFSGHPSVAIITVVDGLATLFSFIGKVSLFFRFSNKKVFCLCLLSVAY